MGKVYQTSILLILPFILGAVLYFNDIGMKPQEPSHYWVGQGILLTREATFSVDAEVTGKVTVIPVDKGAWVAKGTHIATIIDQDRSRILSQIESAQHQIQQLTIAHGILSDRYKSNQALLNEGLISTQKADQSKMALIAAEVAIDDAKANLETLFSNLKNHVSIEQHPYFSNRDRLNFSHDGVSIGFVDDELSKIYAPESGKLLDVFVSPGDEIDFAQPLFSFERPLFNERTLQVVGYFPRAAKRVLYQGMEVKVAFKEKDSQEVKQYPGRIESVKDDYQIRSALLSEHHDRKLVDKLMGRHSQVIRVVVQPLVNHDQREELLNGECCEVILKR